MSSIKPPESGINGVSKDDFLQDMSLSGDKAAMKPGKWIDEDSFKISQLVPCGNQIPGN